MDKERAEELEKKQQDRPRQMLFYPKNQEALIRQYPELGKYDEFKPLTKDQQLFVWYVACMSSPYAFEGEGLNAAKIVMSFNKVYKNGQYSLPLDEEKKWYAGIFPEKISTAIKAMQKFKPAVRTRAKGIIEKMLDNMEKMVAVDINGEEFYDKEGNVDWTKKNAYITSCDRILNMLPTVIEKAESGFGITTQFEESTGSSSSIDSFHNNRD